MLVKRWLTLNFKRYMWRRPVWQPAFQNRAVRYLDPRLLMIIIRLTYCLYNGILTQHIPTSNPAEQLTRSVQACIHGCHNAKIRVIKIMLMTILFIDCCFAMTYSRSYRVDVVWICKILLNTTKVNNNWYKYEKTSLTATNNHLGKATETNDEYFVQNIMRNAYWLYVKNEILWWSILDRENCILKDVIVTIYLL